MQSLGLAETHSSALLKVLAQLRKEELQLGKSKHQEFSLNKKKKSITDTGTLIFTSVLIQTPLFSIRDPTIPFLIKWFYNPQK